MIFTFYSYKGGVGRSMALANVAEHLCRRGLRVAMVDWDLEAPGLEAFFTAGSEDTARDIADRPGLMDLLASYQRLFPRLGLAAALDAQPDSATPERPADGPPAAATPLEVLNDQLPPLQGVLQPVVRPWGAAGDGELLLLSAGWRAGKRFDDYARAVQGFDWADFYRRFQGEAYFNWLRAQLAAAADVVLVDSRTGVTEMGGVCTRQLADVVIAFCAPNNQNLRGVENVIASFHRKDLESVRDSRLEFMVVPARLEITAEKTLLNAFETDFRRHFGGDPPTTRGMQPDFWELQIPYIPAYSFGEQLAVGAPDASRALVAAYEKLALHMALLAAEGSPLRARFTADLQREFPDLLPAVFVACADQALKSEAMALSGRIAKAGISTWSTVADLDGADSQQLLATLEHARHVVLLLTPEAAAREAVRRLWHASRQRGVWVHLVAGAWPAASDSGSLPAWTRGVPVHALGRPEEEMALFDLLRVRGAAPRVPQMAPPLPAGHVPRPAEHEALVRLLLGGKPVVAALCGLGGSGKTTLAAEVCRDEEVLARFDGILWLTLGRNTNMPQQVAALYAALTGDAATFATDEEATAKLQAAVSGREGCLVVVDDVLDVQDFVLPGPLLITASALLITTRDRQVARRREARVVTVGGMAESEAVHLLTGGIAGASPLAANGPEAKTVQEEAAALSRELGLLPLCLRLAGAQLRQEVQSSGDLAGGLSRLRAGLAERGVVSFDDPGAEDRGHSLARTLAESLDLLPRASRLRYLQLAAARSPHSYLNTAGAARLWDVTPDEAAALIARFNDLALLEVAGGDSQQAFRVPGLIRSYLHVRRPGPSDASLAQEIEQLREQAREVLRGRAATFDELVDLATRLKRRNEFGYARRILNLAAQHGTFGRQDEVRQLWVTQQLALCTYKDVDQPADARLDRALEILNGAADLATTTHPETLGIAGAIHKRKWELDGQRQHLERSLAYYLRGVHATSPEARDYDYGYTAINAAFVLDLLASQEEEETRRAGESAESASSAGTRRAQATAIRERLRTDLPRLLAMPDRQWLRGQWWFLATLAEACLGLRRYGEARGWVAQARALPGIVDWELESTARQLAALALCTHGPEALAGDTEVCRVLSDLVDGNEAALLQARVGRVGLALSGGGFRAALFHIGVLARLRSSTSCAASRCCRACPEDRSSVPITTSRCAICCSASATTRSSARTTSTSCGGSRTTSLQACRPTSASASPPTCSPTSGWAWVAATRAPTGWVSSTRAASSGARPAATTVSRPSTS
jgi:hypothetical protein